MNGFINYEEMFSQSIGLKEPAKTLALTKIVVGGTIK